MIPLDRYKKQIEIHCQKHDCRQEGDIVVLEEVQNSIQIVKVILIIKDYEHANYAQYDLSVPH